ISYKTPFTGLSSKRGTYHNELMARGINLQAISVNGWLDFNVYIFNVQPGYTFDYATGRAKVARDFSVGWVK
ncbi:MAG: hypothetical protein N5840_05875, partial [Lactobacillus iners]|nr:hypothetical protein [Lactobacillus iners]